MKRSVPVVLILAVAFFGMTGCGRKSETTLEFTAADQPLPDPPLVASCEPGVRGGRLVVAALGAPKTFSPITEDEIASSIITRRLFTALCGFDRVKQEVTPGLAESWEVAPDQKTWTFKLRRGLHWSDGAPLTADDVVFSFQALYDTNSANVLSDSAKVNGRPCTVTRVGERTVQIVTPEVYAPFLESCAAGVPIIPRHKLAAAVAERKFDSAYGVNTPPADLVGNGPFILKEYKPGERILLERNPWFYEVDTNGTRLPYFDSVLYTITPDMNALSLRFLNGESDVLEEIRADEYEKFKDLAATRKCAFFDLGYVSATTYLWFNQNPNQNEKTGRPYVDPKKLKWFQQKNFRQAVSYAIDRESIAKSIFAGRAVPNYGLVDESNPRWFNPAIHQYPYDLVKARALLADIGIKDRDGDGILEDEDGNPIDFVFSSHVGNALRNRMAVMIQSDLKKLGFKVNYQPMEINALIDRIAVNDYDFVLLGYHFDSLDPAVNYMSMLPSRGHNHNWYSEQKTPATAWEARVDELMNAQAQTFDFDRRKKDFDEVQMILSDEQPLTFTVTPRVYGVIRPDIGNVRPSPLTTRHLTWNIEELYFKK